ncbi:MAG: hypothetical protein MSA68_06450 [Helicobacter sp.]|nr:hypothetical protein [Helicobacter sp.]
MIDFLISHKQRIDVIAQLIQIVVSILGIVGIGIAIFQLIALRTNAKVNTLKTEFDIFGKISEKEKVFVDDYEKLVTSNEAIDKEGLNSYTKNKEQYLRELNLVCSYILDGYFIKEHFFREYGEKILSIYNEIQKDNMIRKYPSIDKVCKKYKEQLELYISPLLVPV